MSPMHRTPWPPLLILLGLSWIGTTWAQDTADPETLRLERELHDLERHKLELEKQIERLKQEHRTISIEADARRQELSRLRNEARVAAFLDRGSRAEADRVRRRSELEIAEGELRRELNELESERQQAVRPLVAERRELMLKQRENRSEKIPDDATLAARLSEIQGEIEDLEAGFRLRRAAIDRRRAAAVQKRYELYRQWAIERGDEAAARNAEQQIEQAAERRAAVEIDSVFDELEHEIRVEYRRLRRAYSETPSEARPEIRSRLDSVRGDLRRLTLSRRTFREENRLALLERRLGAHLQALAKARQAADPTEAEHLEEEILTLRQAISDLVEATLGADRGSGSESMVP